MGEVVRVRNYSAVGNKTVLSNIRGLRTRKSYSQDYMAARLSMKQSSYSKIESGASDITLSKLIQIASVLEVDIVLFFDQW